MAMRIIQYREGLREAMSEEMRRDERVFLMGEEVAEYNGAYKVSQGMLDEFGPRRVIDTPISETGFSGLGIGAAMYGLRPVVEFMSWSFCLVAADQIINNAPKMLYMSGGQFNVPIVFRGNNGAGGQLGSTHSWAIESMFGSLPGLKMAIPATPHDAKGLLKTAIRDDDPVFFLESERLLGFKGPVPPPPPKGEELLIPFGQADVKLHGDDCTVVAFGRAVHFALEAAAQLATEGIYCEVIDPRTVRPLDIETILSSVRKTNYLVVADQSWPFASLAAEIAMQVYELAMDDLDNKIVRVNSDEVPAPYARDLELEMLPNTRKIIDAVRQVTYNA